MLGAGACRVFAVSISSFGLQFRGFAIILLLLQSNFEVLEDLETPNLGQSGSGFCYCRNVDAKGPS